MFALLVVAEGMRVGWQGKHGDFKPVISVVNRIASGDPVYAGNPDGPAYVYSPTFALLLFPLHILPDGLIRFLWYLFSWTVLFWSWLLSHRLIFGSSQNAQPPQGYWVLAIAPIWYFAYYNALNGQSTPLMMFLVLISYYLDNQGKSFSSGLALAGSVLIKPFPVIFLGFFLLRRRFRTCLSMLFWVCALMVLPILYFRDAYASTLQEWLAVNRQQQTIYDISSWGHQSVFAFWYRLFGWQNPPPFFLEMSETIFWAIWVSIALIVLTTVCVTFRANRADGNQDKVHVAFALYMLCWAMLPPTSWKHYYILLLFPVALLAKYAIGPSTPNTLAKVCKGVLLHIKPACCRHLFYDLSLCLFMGLSAFVTLCGASGMNDETQQAESQRFHFLLE